MLISDSHKFIFVHIRKSAGTSVRRLITPYANIQPTDWLSKIKSKSGFEKNYHNFYFQYHSELSLAKKTMPAHIFDEYFKFAIVRNPWARLVSEYEYIKKQTTHGRHKKVTNMTFENYIIYQANRHEAHQINMIVDNQGNLLTNFIGKFENLQEDWKLICQRIQIPHTVLPHANKNQTNRYGEYYNDRTKALVAKLWEKDIHTFEYTFKN